MTDGEQRGVIEAVASVSEKLISSTPTQFLVLVLLNIAFLTVVMWFLNDQLDQRSQLAGKIIDRCLEARINPPPMSVVPMVPAVPR
jgi:hypothetical protein